MNPNVPKAFDSFMMENTDLFRVQVIETVMKKSPGTEQMC